MVDRSMLWKLAAPAAVAVVAIAAFVLWPERTTNRVANGEWTCSMHPQVRLNQPGQCPICGMNLIPISQLKEGSESQKLMGIETEPVKYRELFKEVRTVGKLDYNESRVAYITARFAGRVDRIYADFAGIEVKKGDHLVDIYSPSLVVAQGELLRSLETYEKATGDRSFAEGILETTRAKLDLLGILPEQLKEIERSRKASTFVTIYAPIGGTVIEKSVRFGQYVKEGDMLYQIADLDPIWLYLNVYESDLGWIRYGQPVEVTLEAYPAESFRGMVTFIDPFLDDKTRTVRVRVILKNPDRKLKPAMYASALLRVKLRPDGTPGATGLEGKYICPMHPEVVQDDPGRCTTCAMPLVRVPDMARLAVKASGEHQGHKLAGHDDPNAASKDLDPKPKGVLAIRATAVLDTGRRKITYRLRGDKTFELVDLQIGPRAEGIGDAGQSGAYFPVLQGLNEGDQVVVRGGFLLDSQQQISGMPSVLYEPGQSAANLHSGHAGAPRNPSDARGP